MDQRDEHGALASLRTNPSSAAGGLKRGGYERGCNSSDHALFNAGEAIEPARFFTEDFRLEDPGAGVIRTGLDGALRMMEAVRALAHDGLDIFESGNRVAVRWAYKSAGANFAMMSIY